jgi:hypothetical protein
MYCTTTTIYPTLLLSADSLPYDTLNTRGDDSKNNIMADAQRNRSDEQGYWGYFHPTSGFTYANDRTQALFYYSYDYPSQPTAADRPQRLSYEAPYGQQPSIPLYRVPSAYVDPRYHVSYIRFTEVATFDDPYHYTWSTAYDARSVPFFHSSVASINPPDSMPPARHRDHPPVTQCSGLGLLPTELQMEVMVHLLGKEEREYHVEMESPEPVGGSSFEARADRVMGPYIASFPIAKRIWYDNKRAILRRVASIQLPLVEGWRRAAQSRYVRARMRYAFWLQYHRLTPRRTRNTNIVDRVCAAYEQAMEYDLLEANMASDIKDLGRLIVA